MKKALLTIGICVVLAAIGVGALQYFKPEVLQKFTKLAGVAPAPEVKVEDFYLLDHKGRAQRLYRNSGSKAVVLISTANGCSTMKEAASKIKALQDKFGNQGVVFWLVDSNPEDDRTSIAKEVTQLGLDLPVLEDRAQLLATALGMEQTGDAICINPTSWTTFYHGAIDRSLADAKTKAKGAFLENALAKFLAGKNVSPNRTAAKGTPIRLALATDTGPRAISYANEVAPLLQKNCVSCHSAGNIGPFAMSNYEKVKGRADTIREVLLEQRMPPWHADPHYGTFVNGRSLTPEQAQILVRWVEQGAPRGEGADPLADKAPPAAQDWPLGKPDFIVKWPKAQEVAATGIFDYRYIPVRSPIPTNAWLRAVVVRPGNRKVVHHILVLVATAQELQSGRLRQGQGGGLNGYFCAYVPGYEAVPFPQGSGKHLPAGSMLVFQVHYTATGKAETDASEIGLYLAKEKPATELHTRSAFNVRFEIPPGAQEQETQAEYRFTKDAMLYDMSPHMHLRGSWFTYEAVYPDGKKEILLSVPHYDFKWQHLYRLAQPKRLPAGTRLVCRGAHDNSPLNPDNPDATQTVRFGDQTFNEMFIGYFNYTDAPPTRSVAKADGG
jgi:mono/diheme cytochrome c family protein